MKICQLESRSLCSESINATILLYRCHNFQLRTDLADCGIYIFKYWILKLLEALGGELDIEISSLHVNTLHYIK